jgi:phosphate transport system substrate-binding protein
MPLAAEALAQDGLIQFPMVVGGVVPIVNLTGVKPGQLVLDGPTLADIFLGKITNWNDPRLRDLNPGVRLPDAPIVPVVRGDGSGSTFLFTSYLCKTSVPFKDAVGTGPTAAWPVGTRAKGNEGIAETVAQTSGAIGYVEFAYAKQQALTFTSLINMAGHKIAPSVDSFRAAAHGADWQQTPQFNLVLTATPGDGAWPISGASFILMLRQPQAQEKAHAALAFFDWALTKGQKIAEEQSYVPLPDDLARRVRESWSQASVAGKP